MHSFLGPNALVYSNAKFGYYSGEKHALGVKSYNLCFDLMFLWY